MHRGDRSYADSARHSALKERETVLTVRSMGEALRPFKVHSHVREKDDELEFKVRNRSALDQTTLTSC